MRIANGKIEGPMEIDEDLAVHGMITVAAVLRPGRILHLHGMITGDLDVEPGARALIYGAVNGAIRNHGGTVEIFGTADEIIDLSPDASTSIAPTAMIKGKRH